MSKKEAAIRFIGIFFFFSWCVCIAFFPSLRALLAQRLLSGRRRGRSTQRTRGNNAEPSRVESSRAGGRNVIRGDVNQVAANDRDTGGGGARCKIFELFPATPAAGVASVSLLIAA